MSETITCEWCAEEIPAGSTRCPKCQGTITVGGQAVHKQKPPAGWYDDPSMVNTRRYWDGQKWTEHRQEKATDPTPAPVPVAAEPVQFAGQEQGQGEAAKKGGLGCAGIAAVLVAIVFISSMFGDDDDAPEVDDGGGEYGAIDVCEQRVKDLLKAPATADFSDSKATESEEGVWQVTGVVDAENSFGAKIRRAYGCTARHTTGENWTVKATLVE